MVVTAIVLTPFLPSPNLHAQVAAYGACLQKNVNEIQKDTCGKEFAELKACAAPVMQKLRRR